MTWVNQPHETTNLGRRPATRILRPDSGSVIGRAVECRKEIDCIELFFSIDIQNQIMEETNRRINSYNDLHPNQKVEVNNIPYSVEILRFIMNNNPDRTSHNFFRLGLAFLEGEIAEPSLKKLREVRTQIYSFLTITADLEFC